MAKALVAVLASLIIGFGLALLVIEQEAPAGVNGESLIELNQRLASVEERLDRLEGGSGQNLEPRPTNAEPEGLGPIDDDPAVEEFDQVEDAEIVEAAAPAGPGLRRGFNSQNRQQRLEEAGFGPDQAARIMRREQELRVQSLYDQWQERREDYLAREETANSTGNPLRDELGDQAYERYLEALGRSTSVPISNIMAGAPADSAGFQEGDELVRYNGQRVFDLNDLNELTVQGELGEPVVVDVLRDGNMLQLTLERGPLGIISRPGRRRFGGN